MCVHPSVVFFVVLRLYTLFYVKNGVNVLCFKKFILSLRPNFIEST